jgi:hypothetical protein
MASIPDGHIAGPRRATRGGGNNLPIWVQLLPWVPCVRCDPPALCDQAWQTARDWRQALKIEPLPNKSPFTDLMAASHPALRATTTYFGHSEIDDMRNRKYVRLQREVGESFGAPSLRKTQIQYMNVEHDE